MSRTKVAVSWSGGKDSALALSRAIKEGYEVRCLVSMVSDIHQRNHVHGIRLKILELQAKALGLPIVFIDSGADYAQAFVDGLIQVRKEFGNESVVFGSLYIEHEREWNETVAAAAGLNSLFPVWIDRSEAAELLETFIHEEFSAVVCRASEDHFDASWAGRVLDRQFYKDIQGFDVCPMGECGEYHTFVLDGPIFTQQVDLAETEVVLNERLWSLDVKSVRLKAKVIFKDGPLAVRTLAAADKYLLAKWLTDPEVLAYYEGRDHPQDIEKVEKAFYGDDEGQFRGIILYEEQPIGYIQYYPLDEESKQVYGYSEGQLFGMDQFIGEPEFWNKGTGTRLIGAMKNYLLEQKHADLVTLDPQSWNTRAIRCYQKAGFRKIKLLPKHELHEGEYRDCWLMAAGRLIDENIEN